jgi:RimJ/RimL family protein N-acetyltransferase
MDLTVLDPAKISDDDLAGWHEVRAAALTVDDPDHPPLARASVRAELMAPAADGRKRLWLARDADRGGATVVGCAELFLPDQENLDWGFCAVIVHPEHRRRGFGRALLAAAAEAIVGDGRHTAVLSTGTGEAGPAWAAAIGATYAQRIAESELDLAGADLAADRGTPPRGYRVERWIDRCPERLVESFAEATNAMSDAPDGGLGYQPPRWSTGRVRAAERRRAARETELRVLVAVHEASGQIAGLTELEIDRNSPALAHQEDTAVTPAHRGHGLGLHLKTEMLRWLLAEGSPVRRIRTTTDESNAPMLAINEALGFRRTGFTMQWTIDAAEAATL